MTKFLLAGIVFLASLLAAAFGFNSPNTPTPPNLSGLEPFVIFGSEDVSLAKSTSFSGKLGSNKTLTIAKESEVNGDLIADTIELHKDVTVNGNVSANTLKPQEGVSILGTTATSVSLPIAALPAIADFETGTQDVRPTATATIPAGKYRNITIPQGIFVTFSGGTYAVETLTAFQDAKLLFTATTTLFIKKKLALHDHVVMGTAAGMSLEAVHIFHKGNEPIVIGNRAVLAGTFFAPNTAINAGKEVEMRGRLLAKSIRVDKEGHISIEESFVKETDLTKVVTVDNESFPVNEIVIVLREEATRIDAELISQLVGGRITGFVPNPSAYKIEALTDTAEKLQELIAIIEASHNPLLLFVVQNLRGNTE